MYVESSNKTTLNVRVVFAPLNRSSTTLPLSSRFFANTTPVLLPVMVNLALLIVPSLKETLNGRVRLTGTVNTVETPTSATPSVDVDTILPLVIVACSVVHVTVLMLNNSGPNGTVLLTVTDGVGEGRGVLVTAAV